jgi:3,4-dihydroxy 2-butanone 4-phosphate synthase/GTP cyclohydrolase II
LSKNNPDRIHPITDAIEDIRRGQMIILVDDDDRENEGDFVFAAEKCTPALLNTMMSYGRGLICQPMTGEATQHLQLPQQVFSNEAHLQTAFTISIDAAKGITTGISAADRCTTVLSACRPGALPSDLVRPGHIFPLEAREGGVLCRPGHTEASVDLARLAGLIPQAVICEVLNDQGDAMKLSELFELAKTLDVKVYTIRDLVDYRLRTEPAVEKIEKVQLPTEYGNFTLHVYRPRHGDENDIHLALTLGEERFATEAPLVRVHAEWSIANLINRLSHKDGSRLNQAMKMIHENGSGLVLLLRHSPQLSEDSPFSEVEYPTDIWMEGNFIKTIGSMDPNTGYGMGAQILRDLGIQSMRLISNNDASFKGIGNYGLEIVEKVPLHWESKA